MKPRKQSPLRLKVIRMSNRPVGISTSEIEGYSVRQVGRVCEHLIQAGKIHRGHAGGRLVRFFGRKVDAEAFTDSGRLRRSAYRTKDDDGVRAQWPADAPMHETAETLYTYCPPSMLGVHRTNTFHDEH